MSESLAPHVDTRALLRRLLVIALPMVVSQASETVMLFVDRLFLSRVDGLHLAAAMSGGLTNFTVSSLFAGIAGYGNAIVAQFYGAGHKHRCATTTAQAVYFSFLSLPFLFLVTLVLPRFFELMGHIPAQVELESTYARVLIYGAIFLILRNAISGFFLGIGRTRIVMLSNMVAMIVNVPINYVLIFGALGFPKLGIVGAAIGTVAGSGTAFLILLIAYFRRSVDEEFGTRAALRVDRNIFRRLVKFGTPAGIEILLNVTAFNIFVQLMHSYGPEVAAATTITFNWDIVAFVPMLGLGIATTAVVGQYIGAKDPEGARATTILSLKVGYLYSGTMMVLFLVGAPLLVQVFSAGFDTTGAVSELAKTMVRLAGLYTMADSTQLVFAGALRGAGDTRWVMWASVILHWIFAVLAITLIRVVVAPPIVVWIFFIGFVISLGVTMILRFRAGKWRSMTIID